MRRGSLEEGMADGNLPNPYEIRPSDINRVIDEDFGHVSLSDVGRLIYLRDDIIQMESFEQRDKRRYVSRETRGPSQLASFL